MSEHDAGWVPTDLDLLRARRWRWELGEISRTLNGDAYDEKDRDPRCADAARRFGALEHHVKDALGHDFDALDRLLLGFRSAADEGRRNPASWPPEWDLPFAEPLSPMGQAAVTWARQGFAVFPIRTRTKMPLVKWGSEEPATTDLATVERWWRKWPNANIGCATGSPSGRWMFDVDGPVGRSRLAELEAEHGSLPVTLTVSTGRPEGGEHRWFVGNTELRNSAGKVGRQQGDDPKAGSHLDVRGTGGMALLPPSLHHSGAVYRVIVDEPLIPAPLWLVDLAAKPITKVKPQTGQGVMDQFYRPASGGDAVRLDGIVKAAANRIRSAPEGTRNDTVNRECFAVGGWIDGLGGSFDEVAAVLEAAAAAADQPASMVRRALEEGRIESRGRPPDTVPPETPPSAPGGAMDRLRSAVEGGDPKSLLADHEVLALIGAPGDLIGDVEALLLEVPTPIRHSLKRAGKSKAKKPAQPASTRLKGPPIIAVHGPTWWLRTGKRYSACPPEILTTELGKLYPQICTTRPTSDGGEREAKATELYRDNGGVRVDTLVWEMGATEPRWDETHNTLIVPCCQTIPGRAEFSLVVDGWLRATTGAMYDRVLDWTYYAVMLDQPIAAIYWDGPKGCGKGMYVEGMGQLWGGERSTYDQVVLSSWTAGLRRTPIVHLDERAGRDPQQRGSAAFRSLIGDSSREMTEKFRSGSTIRGCPRLMIMANGPDALRLSDEDLGPADEEAIGERILYIPVCPEGALYLKNLGGRAATKDWCLPDGELVAHLRWIIANHKPSPPGSRFLVEGEVAGWLRGHAHREGMPRKILLAVAQAAANGVPKDIPSPVSFDSGVAYVHCARLHAAWKALTSEDKTPSMTALGRGLSRLGVRRQLDREWVYPILLEQLIDVAQLVGLDEAAIQGRVAW